MPTFPTYRGELPECLNPWKPRHYLLLAYWVFFRPTALKCYLYQADPEIYRAKMGKLVFQTRRIPAYYNLYLMMLIMSLLLGVLLNLPVTLLTGQFLGISVNWLKWTGGIALGLLIGMVGLMASSMVFCMASDIASGTTVGVTFSIIGGAATAVWVGAMAGLGISTMTGMAFGITFTILASIILGIAVGGTFGIKAGIITGIMGGLASGIMIGLLVDFLSIAVMDVEFGVAVGLLGGVVAGVMTGLAFGIGGILINNTVGGVSFGIVCSILLSIMFNVKSGVFVAVGVLRLIFYPFQYVLAVCSGFQKIRHPLEWDELVVLPLPFIRRTLLQKLQQNERAGVYFLIKVGCNAFQRWAVQAALHRYLHAHSSPLHFLYKLLTHRDLDEYMSFPTRPHEWKGNVTARHLFLGELALRFINVHILYHERFAWGLTYLLRERCRTSLTHFAGMLSDLLNENSIEAEYFNFVAYKDIYRNISNYPGGTEITQTFDAIADFLAYDRLAELPQARNISNNLMFDDPIRPTVIIALQRLGQIGAEIQSYQDSTSRANRLAALARATDALKQLDEYAQAEVMAPEQYLLRRIIRQWQQLIISEGGEVGRAEIAGPVANPYVAGNPVMGDLFVGRDDILRRLEELWRGPGQKPSVILYGHRRMGKTSILHNLGARFGSETIVVDFNMQRVGLVQNTGELLFNLALAIYDACVPSDFPEPEETPFQERNPYTVFDRFLKQLDRIRNNRRFIITVDEFELIEQKIRDNHLEAHLLDFWRGVIQTYPWFVMAFAGLHTLEEMTQDYWNPLFGSVTGIPISFLSDAAARTLIVQPCPDFDLDYDADAIAQIIAMTHGQPYLLQLICHGLVSRFNRQTFEQGVERERRFLLADVEAVITAPEFYRDGNAYFSGVWHQAKNGEASGQLAILGLLANAEDGLSTEILQQQSGFSQEELQHALTILQRHDVIVSQNQHWRFTVELMRRWVAHHQSSE